MASGALVNATQLRRALLQCIEYNARVGAEGLNNRKIVPCIWGKPGIGKTSVVKQLEEDNIEVIDVPLAQFEEMGEIHGLPDKVTENGVARTRTAIPHWVPQDKSVEKRYALVFDDWNRADIRIIKGMMQVFQNAGTISWDLPAGATIVLTGNDDDGQQLVTGVDTAIMTRIRHFELSPDHIVWASWARSTDRVDDRIINFVLKYKEQFCPNKPDGKTNPRTLTELGEFLKITPGLEERDVKLHALSALDVETVTAFEKFIKNELGFLMSPEDILAGKWEVAKLEKMATENRVDILNTIMDRLYVEVCNTKRTDKKHQELLKFIKHKAIPADLRAAFVKRMSVGNDRRKHEWIVDDELTDLICDIYN